MLKHALTSLAAACALSSLIVMPAQSRILPNLYALRYCELRSMGMDKQSAIRIAVRDALISEPDEIITYEGRQVQAGIYEAAVTVSRKCPQYFNQ
jgi:hypothetical protein